MEIFTEKEAFDDRQPGGEASESSGRIIDLHAAELLQKSKAAAIKTVAIEEAAGIYERV